MTVQRAWCMKVGLLSLPSGSGFAVKNLRPYASQTLIILCLFGVALAIRLPYLLVLPRFEDEGIEVLWGLNIALGKGLPLTGCDPYYGPLFSYLVAGFFYCFGVNILWPRLMVAICNALTVAATYWLGCTVADQRTGIIASLFAMVSPVLVVVSSHYGWSNSLTPLFATVALAAIYAGAAKQHTPLLALGGFMAGLMLQTHPLSVVLLVAISASFILWKEWVILLKKSTTYVALCFFLFGYAPMIWATARDYHQLINSIRMRTYAYVPLQNTGEIAGRLASLLSSVQQTIAPVYVNDVLRSVNAMKILSIIYWVLMIGLAVTAFIYGLTSHRRRVLPSMFLISCLLLPLLTRVYYQRYLAFLLPIAYVCMGDRLGIILKYLGDAPLRVTGRDRATRQAARIVGISILAILLVGPVGQIWERYRQYLVIGRSNSVFFDLRDLLWKNNACVDSVFIEDIDEIAALNKDSWAFFNFHTIQYVLILDRCALSVRPASVLIDLLSRRRIKDAWLIIPDQSVPMFSQYFELSSVMPITPQPPTSPELRLALYRCHQRQ